MMYMKFIGDNEEKLLRWSQILRRSHVSELLGFRKVRSVPIGGLQLMPQEGGDRLRALALYHNTCQRWKFVEVSTWFHYSEK